MSLAPVVIAPNAVIHKIMPKRVGDMIAARINGYGNLSLNRPGFTGDSIS